jgi:glucose-1-phosphate adenylyltransferase
MRRGQALAIVQAGGQGARMDVLTRERAKPALPFGGVHRLVDFALSGLYHAGLDDVWVSVQYQVASIDDYLAGGRPWSMDRNRGGFRRMVPQTGTGPSSEEGFASGNADLLLKLHAEIAEHGAEHVVVTSADHVFNTDLAAVVEEHVARGSTATLVTAEVTKREAADNVAVLTGQDGVVRDLEVKMSRPGTGTVATEIFVYGTAPLLATLEELRAELDDEADDDSDGDAGHDSGLGDFGDHLLPRLVSSGTVRAVPMEGYWRDLGRPHTYLQGHRDLLAGKVDVFSQPGRPVIAHWPDRPAARVRPSARLTDSLLSPGCDVAGEVSGSVLGPGVVVEKGARVRDSVIFADSVIRRGAVVQTTIVDDDTELRRGARVGAVPATRVAHDEDIVLVGRCSVIESVVDAGARLEPGTTV